MSAPFMQLYVADYLGDTRHLTTEQHGAYLLLLMTMWRSDGVLSDDPAKLARIAGLTVSRWKKISDDVLAFFTPCEGGLTQRRLAAELTIADEKSEKNAQSGRMGGRAKSLKDKKAQIANASLSPWPLEPEPEPTQKEDKLLSVTRTGGLDFEGWWSDYPDAVAKPKARQAYVAAVAKIGGANPDAVLRDGLMRSIGSARWQDPTHTKPNPTRWLEEERWNDRDPVHAVSIQSDTPRAPFDLAARLALLESMS